MDLDRRFRFVVHHGAEYPICAPMPTSPNHADAVDQRDAVLDTNRLFAVRGSRWTPS